MLLSSLQGWLFAVPVLTAVWAAVRVTCCAPRYIPLELLEVVPQRLHWRAPAYVARSQLESLLASNSAADWISISEMLLGPVPEGFTFAPKHKANAYAGSEGSMAFEGQDNG